MTTEAAPPLDSQPIPLPIAPPTMPNLGHQLSAEEARFFETGELPATLAPPPPAAPPAPPEPVPAPIVEPAPAPRDDKGRFAPRVEPDADIARVIAAEAARAAAAEAKLDALQARLDELSRPKPPPPPDRNIDPLGALEHQIAEQTRLLAELRTRAEADMQARSEREAHQAFARSIRDMREAFIKDAPDYDAAYKHIRDSRLEELELVGLTPQQAEQQLAQEEFALATAEVRKGRNPVKTIYELARKRGYAPTSTPPAPTAAKPEDRLATILAAAEAAKGVERGGAPSEIDLTLATVRNASPTQLDKLTADESAWAKFTGSKQGLF
jgi:hypothetical protein